jgi:hypothetical protein
MQLFQVSGRSRSRRIEEPWVVKLSIQDARNQTGSRHDPQMLTERAVPADPYQAWLEQREGDRCSSAIPV